MSKIGPAAFLKAFCKGKCQSLKHAKCSDHRCPCDEARAWLRTLPKTMPLEEAWNACPDLNWMRWVCGRLGLAHRGHSSCAELRADVPWSTVESAMANPPTTGTCEDCGDVEEIADMHDGRCEDCDGNYEYCDICDDRPHTDSLCDHLRWSNAAGCIVGTGSDSPSSHEESFNMLLTRLGMRHARVLRERIADGSYWTWATHYGDLGKAIEALRDHARDSGDRHDTEMGGLWLETLDSSTELRPSIEMTLGWIDKHLAARAAIIAADKRPMRVLRDGAGRYFVRGQWAAIREQAEWMQKRPAARVRRRLAKLYPTAGIRVVHVLTAMPVMGEKR